MARNPNQMSPLPKDMADFILRRWDKRKAYTYARLEDYFDGFFTSYVLYNFFYNLVWSRFQRGQTKDKDRERATKVLPEFLCWGTIHENARVKRAASELESALRNGGFSICNPLWDKKQLDRLSMDDPKTWGKALINIVYKIRCNTFHGEKAFQDPQRAVLKPCIEILEALNDLAITKLLPNSALHRTATGHR